MAKDFGDQLKLLYIKDFLLENSDAEHPVTVDDIINDLWDSHLLAAERRAIYRYLKLLSYDEEEGLGYGLDIKTAGRGKYYVEQRVFTPQEIRILVDMVQTSNAIPMEMSKTLIDKIGGLTSAHEAKKLNRDVYVRNRVKALNNDIYLNVDTIAHAITEDKAIHFKYYSYTTEKKKTPRHEGKVYTVSPFSFVWVDQNYYLLAYDHDASPKTGRLHHFRVDRMTEVSLARKKREGREIYEKTDISTYTMKTFYMFGGEEHQLVLRFKNYLADAVIDRFGEDVMMHPDGEEHFVVTVPVVVSVQFFAWMSAYGKDAEIVAPESVRQQFKDHLNEILENY